MGGRGTSGRCHDEVKAYLFRAAGGIKYGEAPRLCEAEVDALIYHFWGSVNCISAGLLRFRAEVWPRPHQIEAIKYRLIKAMLKLCWTQTALALSSSHDDVP